MILAKTSSKHSENWGERSSYKGIISSPATFCSQTSLRLERRIEAKTIGACKRWDSCSLHNENYIYQNFRFLVVTHLLLTSYFYFYFFVNYLFTVYALHTCVISWFMVSFVAYSNGLFNFVLQFFPQKDVSDSGLKKDSIGWSIHNCVQFGGTIVILHYMWLTILNYWDCIRMTGPLFGV